MVILLKSHYLLSTLLIILNDILEPIIKYVLFRLLKRLTFCTETVATGLQTKRNKKLVNMTLEWSSTSKCFWSMILIAMYKSAFFCVCVCVCVHVCSWIYGEQAGIIGKLQNVGSLHFVDIIMELGLLGLAVSTSTQWTISWTWNKNSEPQ